MAVALTPFVFSATSESALQRVLSNYRNFLMEHPDTNLLDLAWTLRARRSALPVKVAISAPSAVELTSMIGEKLESIQKNPTMTVGVRSSSGEQKILGVFTGQGAQWAGMGKSLVNSLPQAQKLVRELDDSLQQLPKSHRPSWSITEELSKDAASSRLQEAAFSQPLCTVVQVILVDVLKAAGIGFSAVVGHSSGEMGAAYAAGYISACDAVRIAYLRGLFAKLASGPNDERGSMMAVGTSVEAAKTLCNLPEFKGRIYLAASNSPASVTLSGDESAINQAKTVLDESKTFARLLKVDTAYHSHHMQPAAAPYVEALNSVGITIKTPVDGCMWYSSVFDSTRMDAKDPMLSQSLRGTYWRDNMVNPVWFSQAITHALQSGPFQTVLEVGPHPALKGPASQTLSDLGLDIPYFGTLKRGVDDFEAISACFGSVWTTLGASAIDFDGAQNQLYSDDTPAPTARLLKNLPSYVWDHDKAYWYESRRSKLFRSRAQPSHELLGVRCDEGDEHELRWRNFLSVQEIPWLDGHQIQGQTVFPAAGYVSSKFSN
jgi:hybrid polyketide synthase/nonribosomal peptide synthetase ACE1